MIEERQTQIESAKTANDKATSDISVLQAQIEEKEKAITELHQKSELTEKQSVQLQAQLSEFE